MGRAVTIYSNTAGHMNLLLDELALDEIILDEMGT